MKFLCTLILALTTVSTIAQTKLDSLVFNKVNEYRISMGLSKLKFDTTCFKAASLHTKFLTKTDKVGHKEDTLIDTKDRLGFYDKTHKWTIINEVAISTNINLNKSDSIDEKLSILIVNSWEKSIKHNEALLDNLFCSGVECIVKVTPTGISNINNYQVVSTMVLVGGIYRKK